MFVHEPSLMALAPTSVLYLSGRASKTSNRMVLGSTPDRSTRIFFRVCLCHLLNNTASSLILSYNITENIYLETFVTWLKKFL